MSEALAVIQREPEALAVGTREEAGMLAMATMPEAEFAQRLAALKRGQERIRRIKQELMEEDAHYGIITGTKKPTLLKPGAEVLCSIYGLRPDFIPTLTPGDGVTAPHLPVGGKPRTHAVAPERGPSREVAARGHAGCEASRAHHRRVRVPRDPGGGLAQ